MSNYNKIILSPPENIENEHQILVKLFGVGLKCFHLRKPNFNDIEYAQYLAQIPAEYWNRIVLHDHHHLAAQLGLCGIHLTERHRKGKNEKELQILIKDFRAEGMQISAAIHDLKDLAVLGHLCDYVLISPVFDSISKSDYKANPDLDLQEWKGKGRAKLIALGGINRQNARIAIEKGFDGIAALGYIWEEPKEAIQRYESLSKITSKNTLKKGLRQLLKNIEQDAKTTRPYVLTIAGHDPSAGAGLSADLKTFEQQKVYGLSVCSAITIQNDKEFKAVQWTTMDLIQQQIYILKKAYKIEVMKVGLIENWTILAFIITAFKGKTIIFDPILSASAGFEFHTSFDRDKLYELLKSITLITPNREEILELTPHKNAEKAAQFLSQYCAVLLKGGHDEARLGEDQLWKAGKQIAVFEAEKVINSGKHGSGCVLSAAIAAQLLKEKSLEVACKEGKKYVENFLNSNRSKLGYHKI